MTQSDDSACPCGGRFCPRDGETPDRHLSRIQAGLEGLLAEHAAVYASLGFGDDGEAENAAEHACVLVAETPGPLDMDEQSSFNAWDKWIERFDAVYGHVRRVRAQTAQLALPFGEAPGPAPAEPVTDDDPRFVVPLR